MSMNTADTFPEILTSFEAAKMLGMSRSNLMLALKEESLPNPTMVGANKVWLREGLLCWLSERAGIPLEQIKGSLSGKRPLLLGIEETAEFLGLTTWQIRERRKLNKPFPSPVAIGRRKLRWLRLTIENWRYGSAYDSCCL